MLEAAIGLIASQLNQALRSAFQLSEDLVVVTSLVDVDGGAPANASNKLAVFLANIERETVVAVERQPSVGGGHVIGVVRVAGAG